MSTHQDSLAAFFGRSPLSSVPPGYNRFIMIEVIKVEIEYINLQYISISLKFIEFLLQSAVRIYDFSTTICDYHLSRYFWEVVENSFPLSLKGPRSVQ